MRTIFRNISLILATILLWTGCRGGLDLPEAGIPDHCIEITLGGVHPSLNTKADDTSPGDDAYNENLVETVDCFFYPNGGTGSDAVFTALGRGAEVVTENGETVYKVKIFFTDADANRMFGSTVSGTCQLYVICNAPLSYDGHTDVATLKNLVVENDFTAQTVQRSFVMSADEVATVTLLTTGEGDSRTRTASGRVEVSRAAAKIQFFLLIPSQFKDEADQFWEPVLDAGISISMSNAVKRGKVDGEYTVQSADYVSYGPRALAALAEGKEITGYEDYKYTHVPFYSYPCAWSDLSDYATTVVFSIPWRIVGESDYQWKKYQLSPNISTLSLERNKYYRTFVNVKSLGGADKESLVIISECDYEIIPWMNDNASGSGQGEVPGALITYKYLVMDHPEQTVNNETKVFFSYISSSPISSIKIKKIEYYNNGNTTPLRTEIINRTISDDNVTISTVNVGDITVNKENPGYVTFTHSLENMYSPITVYATVKNEDNCEQDVIFVQNPSIMAICDYEHMGNVFVDGFFGRVKDAAFGVEWDTTNNYFKGPGTSTASGGRPEVYVQLPNVNGNNYDTYGSVSQRGDYNSFFTTEITVSSFNSKNNKYTYTLDGVAADSVAYRIGDARLPAKLVYNNSWTLFPYLKNWNGNTNYTTVAWDHPEEILITAQDVDKQSFIAPRFLISSQLNAQNRKPSGYDNAVKRAATYQEAGYPAGRWRLPTEAEIAFIIARQQDGTIPALFTSESSGYWTASKRRLQLASGGTINITSRQNPNSDGYSSRFIYDLWYWGDEPSTTDVYHPNGHLYNYDSAGNATPIR